VDGASTAGRRALAARSHSWRGPVKNRGSKLEEGALYNGGVNLTARVRAPQVTPKALECRKGCRGNPEA
jgi:hypothetical protein